MHKVILVSSDVGDSSVRSYRLTTTPEVNGVVHRRGGNEGVNPVLCVLVICIC